MMHCEAQFFNNVNNELCFELYRTSDVVGNYRVYVAVDTENFNDIDMVVLKNWSLLNQAQRSKIVQGWGVLGKRIEAEREPFITYPPVFPKPNKPFPLKTVDQKIDNWGPWNDNKKGWAYPNKPF